MEDIWGMYYLIIGHITPFIESGQDQMPSMFNKRRPNRGQCTSRFFIAPYLIHKKLLQVVQSHSIFKNVRQDSTAAMSKLSQAT